MGLTKSFFPAVVEPRSKATTNPPFCGRKKKEGETKLSIPVLNLSTSIGGEANLQKNETLIRRLMLGSGSEISLLGPAAGILL